MEANRWRRNALGSSSFATTARPSTPQERFVDFVNFASFVRTGFPRAKLRLLEKGSHKEHKVYKVHKSLTLTCSSIARAAGCRQRSSPSHCKIIEGGAGSVGSAAGLCCSILPCQPAAA